MDTLIYPPAAPIPLILPRSLSFQAGSISDLHKASSRARKASFTAEPASSSPSSSATSPISIGASNNEQQQQLGIRRQSSFSFPASTSLPATYTFLPPSTSSSSNSSKDSSSTTTMIRSQIRRQRRRHTITGGGFTWTTTTTLPPRHALHMPVMKISPIVRRKEQHQRNIHRLMHEGREVEVMRRRGVATVMDTSEEGDEEDEEGGMAGVVFTGASIQQAQSALNERAQMQAKQEFAMLVAESSKAYQEILHQQHLQLQQQRAEEEQRRRNSWPKQQQTTTGTGTGAISYANVPLTLQQQQQHRQAYLQQQAQQQQKLIQLQQQHQHQLQFQQQKQLLLHQQQQLQQQIQQQQLYKQRMYASSNPAFNTHAGFPSPHPQAQQQQQLMQIQTPQQRGANALNFVKTLDQNNAATTASNWSYASQHAASTGRLSLY